MLNRVSSSTTSSHPPVPRSAALCCLGGIFQNSTQKDTSGISTQPGSPIYSLSFYKTNFNPKNFHDNKRPFNQQTIKKHLAHVFSALTENVQIFNNLVDTYKRETDISTKNAIENQIKHSFKRITQIKKFIELITDQGDKINRNKSTDFTCYYPETSLDKAIKIHSDCNEKMKSLNTTKTQSPYGCFKKPPKEANSLIVGGDSYKLNKILDLPLSGTDTVKALLARNMSSTDEFDENNYIVDPKTNTVTFNGKTLISNPKSTLFSETHSVNQFELDSDQVHGAQELGYEHNLDHETPAAAEPGAEPHHIELELVDGGEHALDGLDDRDIHVEFNHNDENDVSARQRPYPKEKLDVSIQKVHSHRKSQEYSLVIKHLIFNENTNCYDQANKTTQLFPDKTYHATKRYKELKIKIEKVVKLDLQTIEHHLKNNFKNLRVYKNQFDLLHKKFKFWPTELNADSAEIKELQKLQNYLTDTTYIIDILFGLKEAISPSPSYYFDSYASPAKRDSLVKGCKTAINNLQTKQPSCCNGKLRKQQRTRAGLTLDDTKAKVDAIQKAKDLLRLYSKNPKWQYLTPNKLLNLNTNKQTNLLYLLCTEMPDFDFQSSVKTYNTEGSFTFHSKYSTDTVDATVFMAAAPPVEKINIKFEQSKITVKRLTLNEKKLSYATTQEIRYKINLTDLSIDPLPIFYCGPPRVSKAAVDDARSAVKFKSESIKSRLLPEEGPVTEKKLTNLVPFLELFTLIGLDLIRKPDEGSNRGVEEQKGNGDPEEDQVYSWESFNKNAVNTWWIENINDRFFNSQFNNIMTHFGINDDAKAKLKWYIIQRIFSTETLKQDPSSSKMTICFSIGKLPLLRVLYKQSKDSSNIHRIGKYKLPDLSNSRPCIPRAIKFKPVQWKETIVDNMSYNSIISNPSYSLCDRRDPTYFGTSFSKYHSYPELLSTSAQHIYGEQLLPVKP